MRFEKLYGHMIKFISFLNEKAMAAAGKVNQFCVWYQFLEDPGILRRYQRVIVSCHDHGGDFYIFQPVHGVVLEAGVKLSLEGLRWLVVLQRKINEFLDFIRVFPYKFIRKVNVCSICSGVSPSFAVNFFILSGLIRIARLPPQLVHPSIRSRTRSG